MIEWDHTATSGPLLEAGVGHGDFGTTIYSNPPSPLDGFGLPADGYWVVATAAPPVPEPGTLALLAAGLFGLVAYAWRKRK